MKVSPYAGKPAEPSMPVNVPRLVTAYYAERPDPEVPAQRVSFGTSGHRGSAFDKAFNEWHIPAISQAICLYRAQHQIKDGIIPALLAAEITARMGRDPSEIYRDLTRDFYDRVQATATNYWRSSHPSRSRSPSWRAIVEAHLRIAGQLDVAGPSTMVDQGDQANFRVLVCPYWFNQDGRPTVDSFCQQGLGPGARRADV